MTDTGSMSDAEHTQETAGGSDHGHDQDPGHGHGHAAAGEALGPVDLTTWAYAIAGSVLAILTILALYVAGGA